MLLRKHRSLWTILPHTNSRNGTKLWVLRPDFGKIVTTLHQASLDECDITVITTHFGHSEVKHNLWYRCQEESVSEVTRMGRIRQALDKGESVKRKRIDADTQPELGGHRGSFVYKQLFGGARFCFSSSWIKTIVQNFRKIQGVDFEIILNRRTDEPDLTMSPLLCRGTKKCTLGNPVIPNMTPAAYYWNQQDTTFRKVSEKSKA